MIKNYKIYSFAFLGKMFATWNLEQQLSVQIQQSVQAKTQCLYILQVFNYFKYI
jgi:hypothetical protein